MTQIWWQMSEQSCEALKLVLLCTTFSNFTDQWPLTKPHLTTYLCNKYSLKTNLFEGHISQNIHSWWGKLILRITFIAILGKVAAEGPCKPLVPPSTASNVTNHQLLRNVFIYLLKFTSQVSHLFMLNYTYYFTLVYDTFRLVMGSECKSWLLQNLTSRKLWLTFVFL